MRRDKSCGATNGERVRSGRDGLSLHGQENATEQIAADTIAIADLLDGEASIPSKVNHGHAALDGAAGRSGEVPQVALQRRPSVGDAGRRGSVELRPGQKPKRPADV